MAQTPEATILTLSTFGYVKMNINITKNMRRLTIASLLILSACGGGGSAGNVCVSDTDCDAALICTDGRCTGPLLELGTACSTDTECGNGNCSDGVCCDEACDGECVACLAIFTGGTDGSCDVVTMGTDPAGECNDEGAASCGANGTGCSGDSQNPGCNLYPADTECEEQSCTGGTFVAPAKCDGARSCLSGASTQCSPGICNAEGMGCETTCDSNGQCEDGAYCDAFGQCIGEKVQGQNCAEGFECTSGSCTDGVCCDSACSADCEACSIAAGAVSNGTCSVLPLGLSSSPSCTKGLCNGIDAGCTAACESGEARPVRIPLDIVLAFDNSASMGEEATGVEQTINTNLAQVLAAAEVDSQLIIVADHGSDSTDLCIQPPLSGTTNCNAAPVNIPGQFQHYSVDVQSHDAMCVLLDTFSGANGGGESDEFNLFPDGWSAVLRPESHKAFIIVSDDGTNCSLNGNTFNDGNTIDIGRTTAEDFDSALLALSPSQFGTLDERKYSWHSLIALEARNPADPLALWLPTAPATVGECTPGAVDPGTGYQALSQGTGGLRYPLCDPSGYGNFYSEVAAQLVARTRTCMFALPDPNGQVINTASVVLTLTPSGGTAEELVRVLDAGSCVDRGYFVANGNVELCATLCEEVLADTQSALFASYLCE